MANPEQPRTPPRVQSDNLLSQPDPASGVAEEVSLDQQSGQARKVGQLPPAAQQPLADALRPERKEGSG